MYNSNSWLERQLARQRRNQSRNEVEKMGTNSTKKNFSDEEYETKNGGIKRINPKTGRNELCPCGSGKKYKNCCMHKEDK